MSNSELGLIVGRISDPNLEKLEPDYDRLGILLTGSGDTYEVVDNESLEVIETSVGASDCYTIRQLNHLHSQKMEAAEIGVVDDVTEDDLIGKWVFLDPALAGEEHLKRKLPEYEDVIKTENHSLMDDYLFKLSIEEIAEKFRTWHDELSNLTGTCPECGETVAFSPEQFSSEFKAHGKKGIKGGFVALCALAAAGAVDFVTLKALIEHHEFFIQILDGIAMKLVGEGLIAIAGGIIASNRNLLFEALLMLLGDDGIISGTEIYYDGDSAFHHAGEFCDKTPDSERGPVYYTW